MTYRTLVGPGSFADPGPAGGGFCGYDASESSTSVACSSSLPR
jgi:hypothetical protein